MSSVVDVVRPYRVTAAEFEALPVPTLHRERREAIRDLAASMFAVDLTGTDLVKIKRGDPLAQAVNHFSPGIYAREYHMHAGMRIVGMRHTQEHINIVSCGRATVYTEEGVTEVIGPCTFISPAGTQRFLHIHEYMIWTTVHRTDAQDEESALADLSIDETGLIADRIKALGAPT